MKSYKTETFPLQKLDKRMMAVVVLWEINKYFTESTFLVEYFQNVIIFEVVQAKLFEHQIIENNLYNNGQRIRNCKLFYYTIFIMLSNNSFLSAKIRFLSNYKNILLKKLFLG